MAWIESHQSLRLHPKTLFVCAAMKAKRHDVIGHLQCLWWWGLDVADLDGWLPTGTNALTVAGGAEWPDKQADAFLHALLGAGFMEEEAGRYRLHDWWEFAGKWNAKRAANKQRMRDARATHVQRTNDARATHVQGLPTNLPNQPNQPEPNGSIPTSTSHQPPPIFRLYENLFGTVNSLVAQELIEAEADYPKDWIEDAFKETADNNGKSWRYVARILERWKREGRQNGVEELADEDTRPVQWKIALLHDDKVTMERIHAELRAEGKPGWT